MSRIDDDISSDSFSHIYLLTGTEKYLKEDDCSRLVRALAAEGDTMNHSRYRGKDIPLSEVLDTARTMPFFASRRLIEIRNSGLFKGAKENADMTALLELVKNVPETTYIIFCEEETDARGKLYKAVKENGAVIEYKTPDPGTLKRWIAVWMKKHDRMITGEAADELLSRTGTDMMTLSMEMNKLVDYTMGKEGIGKQDVEALCTARPEDEIFKMINAISARDQKTALAYYFQLLSLNTDPSRILALLTREYNLLWQVKELKEQGFDRDSIASQLKLRPYFMRQYLQNASAYTREELIAILESCARAEEKFKTGKMDRQLAVELLIIKASHGK